MSLNHSPKIVTDGLVLCLDAASRKSYPGSGTTWFDRSGNGNHLYWSSPAPSFTNYNNVPVISTNPIYTSLRAAKSTTYNGMKTGTASYTVFSFFRPNQITAGKILISFGPANNECEGRSVHPISIGASGKFVGGFCGAFGTWNDNTGVTPTTDRFWNVCSTYDGATERVYVNGVFEKSANYISNTPVNAANAISLGWIRNDGASYSMDASIGNVFIYNRTLSIQEIQQNFNATRGRFGI